MAMVLPLTRSALLKVFGPSEQPSVSVSMNSDRVAFRQAVADLDGHVRYSLVIIRTRKYA
jgi:hypothetical protein